MLELHPEDLKKQWLHRRVGSINSNKGGEGGLSGPPSLQIVFCLFLYPLSAPFLDPPIHNMLNGPGWSRRDHADWYTVLTNPANDD